MPIPIDTRDDALDAIEFTDASLHTAWPGATGSNEVSGGNYARQAVVIGASSGASRSLVGTATFAIPGGVTVKWIGLWDSTQFRCAMPNGGATPKNFMALPSNDRVYSSGHGWIDGQAVTFFNGTPPAPLVEGTTYYVLDANSESFKVSASAEGSAIGLTAAPSFGCVVAAITEDTYPSSGTHQLTSGTITIPD
jgi:hypothetical protein